MIKIHNQEEFQYMRNAGKLAAEVLDYITPYVVPGVSTEELNNRCHDFIISNNAIPAPLNYRGYPKSVCISRNDVICHGISSTTELIKNNDILNIDVTVILDEFHGDTSRMFVMPNAKIKPKRLVECTYNAMMAGISVVRPGVKLIEINKAIQHVANQYGYGNGVVREFIGHGVGRVFHTEPNIFHYYEPQQENDPNFNIELQTGMFFTVEPMINGGIWKSRMMSDNWTAKTRDGQPSAQFEHTIGVTDNGYEIFTTSPAGYTKPPYELP